MTITLATLKERRKALQDAIDTKGEAKAKLKLEKKVLPYLYRKPLGVYHTTDEYLLRLAREFGLVTFGEYGWCGYRYGIRIPKEWE